MPQLTSKVQHKNYEKGEFDEEQKRDLAGTLQLIQNFPWDAERTLTVIQLTGPSVTIKDDDGNYLKVGLYFNGKFCLYCLHHAHLYEYHTSPMEDVNKLVTDFFNSTLDLTTFEKHLLSIGSRAHFQTNSFVYRLQPWRISAFVAFMLIYAILLLVLIGLTMSGQHQSVSMLIVPLLLYSCFVLWIANKAYRNRDAYLEISRGKDAFKFGLTSDTVATYYKTNINEILADGNRRRAANNRITGEYIIIFKNGETIRISNMLINNIDFYGKFLDSMDNITTPFVYSAGSIFQKSANPKAE